MVATAVFDETQADEVVTSRVVLSANRAVAIICIVVSLTPWLVMTTALTAGPAGAAGSDGDGATGLSTELPEHAIRLVIARVAVARHTRFIHASPVRQPHAQRG